VRFWPAALLVAGLILADVRAQPGRAASGPPGPPGALLPRRPELENLLRTAQDAINRRDWKLAIDSLQRIIDDPAGALLPATEQAEGFLVRESARNRALAMLAGMDAEGRAAYRLLNDGKAEALWRKAVDLGDQGALHVLVENYLLTGKGDDAADLLAAMLIDRGLPADALEVLERMSALHQDVDVPAERIAIKRAVCRLMLGDQKLAETELADLNPAAGEGAELATIAELITSGWRAAPDGGLEGGETWLRAGGSLARTGRMPTISPELRDNLPWRYSLPTDDPDWWDREYLPFRDHERGLPALSPVVGDGRLFVKILSQVVALDVESLEPLWQSDPPPETSQTPRYQTSPRLIRFTPERKFDRFSTRERLLYDYVANELAVIDAGVFEIEREGVNKYAHHGQDRVQSTSAHREGFLEGTRLIARNASTGNILWERGRTGSADDPLGNIYFLSVPIGVPARDRSGSAAGMTGPSPAPAGNELWTVYARNNDIVLGVLDAAQGALLRELLLCTVDMRELSALLHEAVYPTTDGRTLYLCMSAGQVLAVDMESFALRWATAYPRAMRIDGSLAPASWLCGPAIVGGRALLAAPPDSEYLLALDRADGRLLWRYPRPAPVYSIIGADEERVWLGGDAFTCLALADGRELWRGLGGAALDVTGRAALAGDFIHVPTVDGLVTLDAGTGELVQQQDLPRDQLPLGNLLCLASAMFSVDTNEVRKFPDLTVSYPRLLARFEAEPQNARTAIRLAWMELLRDAPRRALEVLGQVERRGRYGNDVRRLRIDALLRLAQAKDVPDQEASALLTEALELTDADFDRLRATLALSDRWRRMGRSDEAYLLLWRLGLTSAGEGYVTIEPKLRNKSRLVIAEVLARYERQLTARQLAAIAAESHATLERAVADLATNAVAGASRLGRLAELDDAGGAGQAALVALGKHECARGRYERSEQYYLEAIRRDRTAAVTAEALRDLAQQYLGPEQQFAWEAAQLLDVLDRSFAGVELPAGDVRTTGSAEAERLRRQIDAADVARGSTFVHPARFTLEPRRDGASRPHLTAASLFELTGKRGEAASRRVLLLDGPSTVRAVLPGEWDPVWTAALELLNVTPEDETVNPELFERIHAVAMCDGQTVVLNGATGLFGLGTLTGRRLWGVPYEEQVSIDRASLRNRLVAVDRGRLICAPRRGLLTCRSLVDGMDVRWERVLPDERIDTVFLKDDYCITLDNLRERATAYDASSGRLICRLEFRQPAEDQPSIPLVYAAGCLVGPVDAGTVACYALRSGEENWRITLPEPVRWAFNAGEGYVGVAGEDGHFRLVDILAGDVVIETQLREAPAGMVEGIVCGPTLLLMPVTGATRGHEPALVSLDVATGRELWKRSGFGATGADRFALWKLLHAASDVVPMLRRVESDRTGQFGSSAGEIAVEIVDKRTGQTLGPVVSTEHLVTIAEELDGEFGLWPGWLLLGSRERGIIALATTDEAAAAASAAGDGRMR